MAFTADLTKIKIAENAAKINTNANANTENLKEKYYDDLFSNLKENQYGDAKLTAEQEKDLNTVVMNAINYASETVANRDGKSGQDNTKDGAVNLAEWATDSTYVYLGLDINNKDDVNKMESVFNTMDKDGDGKLDEKELMAVYLYKDATSNGMPNANEEIIFDGSVNSGKERNGLAGNMLSLADNEGKTLFNNIFSFLDKAPAQEPVLKGESGSLNGVIEDSAQGETGDCWFLAGLNSLSYSDKGREVISDSININDDGTYTVNFKGVKQSYTFSKDEIEEARNSGQYSTGDDDVLLMEIATEKFLKELREGKVEAPVDAPNFLSEEDCATGRSGQYLANPLDGGVPTDTLYLLTGQQANNQYNHEHPFYKDFVEEYGIEGDNPNEGYSVGTSLDYAYDKIEENKGNVWATLVTGYDDKTECEITDINGNKVTLTSAECHALSIKSVEDDVVTLVNPWDSSAEIQVTKDELRKFTSDIYFSVL